MLSTVKNFDSHLKRMLKKFSKPVMASKSYRYLARQLVKDLADVEGGKFIVFSSGTRMDVNSEILLMFGHFLHDEAACNVLLIDGTFRNSGLSKFLNLGGRAGIVDHLLNKEYAIDVDTIALPVRKNVSLIGEGNHSGGKLSYVPKSQIDVLFEKVKQKYDYIILQQDHIYLDTRYLPFAKSADMVLLHLEEQITPLSKFDEIRRVFSQHQITNVKYILSEP